MADTPYSADQKRPRHAYSPLSAKPAESGLPDVKGKRTLRGKSPEIRWQDAGEDFRTDALVVKLKNEVGVQPDFSNYLSLDSLSQAFPVFYLTNSVVLHI